MAYAALVYSTIAKGRISTIETSVAEAAPGVVLVMTYQNAPRLHRPPLLLSGEKAAGGDSPPVIQDDSIHWNGQPVALVLAETQEQADHAKSLIRVDYAIDRWCPSRRPGSSAPIQPGSWDNRFTRRSVRRSRL
ncbi:hypothetical protein [Rhizobium cauense]|uniref:hypothetical protein n=1 Tax=Rhizobium cauense TaxID=1166683 RepID=UPI001CB7A55E|nr:hypothetical protein [Rhizobium cauense]